MDMFNKPLKRICKIVGPSLSVSLEPLVHLRNAPRLKLMNHDISIMG